MIEKLKIFIVSMLAACCLAANCFAFEIKDLSKYQGIAVKTFAKWDSLYEGNRQIQETKDLVDVLGTEKRHYKTNFVYTGDHELEYQEETTWYYSDIKSRPGKRKYALYYRKNDIMQAGRAGDTLVIAKKSSDEITLIIVQKGSKQQKELLAFLSLKQPPRETKTELSELSIETIPTDGWIRVYFTPGKDCENNIIVELDKAKKHIDIAVYAITNRHIVDAILAAHRRGVKVRIITDRLQSAGRGSLVSELETAGLPVRKNKGHKIMHHKFAVFDGREIKYGSYNWTASATENNAESCLFFRQPETKSFSKKFMELWELYGQEN